MRNQECRVLLVEDNALNALLVEKMLKSVESPVFRVTRAETLLTALELASRDRFDAALVDLNLPDSNGLDTFLAIQRSAPGLAIVVLSGCESDEIAIKAVEQGAQDYLSKQQVNARNLTRVLQYSVIRSRKHAEERPGQQAATVLAFLGAKGGVGTTTIACHFARELKRQTGETVLLTGIDASAAGVGYLMKTPLQYTVGDAAQNLHRMDPDLWKGMVATTPDGVDVMPPPGAAQFTGLADADAMRQVVRFARGQYQQIVVDLGVLNPLSLSLLEDMARLYVIAAEELPALWEAGRLLGRMTQLGYTAERLHLVVNMKKRRGGLTPGEMEKALGFEVHATVTEARDEMEDLLADGRFIDVKSAVHKDVSKVVAKLLGKGQPETSGASGFSLARLCRV